MVRSSQIRAFPRAAGFRPAIRLYRGCVSRQLRVLFPGALYHVTSRGNERRPIYRTNGDREHFLELLELAIERYRWICHGYCLMGNHYHLVVETPAANLPEGMRHLNGRYAQKFNRRHDRVGHLFQGRYHAVLVEKEAYLLELVRYVSLNPVRKGWCERPEDWRWSGYRALVGLERAPAWLGCGWLLAQFAPNRAQAYARLSEFVRGGIADPKPLPIRAGMYLASDRFLAEKFHGWNPVEEVPRAQCQPLRPSLEDLFATWDQPIAAAYREWGYSLREIARHIGRHYSTVSRRLQRLEAASGA
jgi:REP element-mobilizing transposase RayT